MCGMPSPHGVGMIVPDMLTGLRPESMPPTDDVIPTPKSNWCAFYFAKAVKPFSGDAAES
jgi:hypothetical protein